MGKLNHLVATIQTTFHGIAVGSSGALTPGRLIASKLLRGERLNLRTLIALFRNFNESQ